MGSLRRDKTMGLFGKKQMPHGMSAYPAPLAADPDRLRDAAWKLWAEAQGEQARAIALATFGHDIEAETAAGTAAMLGDRAEKLFNMAREAPAQ